MTIKIRLQNVDADGVLSVSGSHIQVALKDSGQANVSIHLRVSSGDHFFFPDIAGSNPKSTILPPGSYTCILRIDASSDGAFGSTYDSLVSINGVDVAVASGQVSSPPGFDGGKKVFILKVS